MRPSLVIIVIWRVLIMIKASRKGDYFAEHNTILAQ